MGKTLRRYLLREIGAAFLAGIAIFSSILFLLRTLDLIEMIFGRGVPGALVARLLLAILPSFLEAVLPMAFLLGIVLAFGRLSGDGETMALRAAGISVYRILPPVVGLSLVVAAATLTLSMTARPWGHREIESTAFEIAKTRASAALRPRFFNTDFERMVVYVDHIEQDSGELVGVMLSDQRGEDRTTVFARRGRVGGHEDSGRLYLQMVEGTSVTSSEMSPDYDVTSFRTLDVSLELRTATGTTPLSDEPAALTWTDLVEGRRSEDAGRALEARIEMQRRFAIAAAAIALALLGTALGLHPAPGTRSRAVGVSIAVILLFYGLLAVAVAVARGGSLPPALALWMPNVLLTIAAVVAVRRSARDRPALPTFGWRARRATRAAA